MGRDTRPVYSTSTGRLCPECGNPLANCSCKTANDNAPKDGANILILRERKGRAGKDVTVIRNLPLNLIALKLLASELKSQCGSGGTVADGAIEIQGDHRSVLKSTLEDKGYIVKLSGG